MHELSRILTSLGVVAASTGLIVYGMAASYYNPGGFDLSLGLWLMIIGTIVSIIGWVMYRQSWVEEA